MRQRTSNQSSRVPRQFTKFFPADHPARDEAVALCKKCHDEYEEEADKLRD